jgi:hypothetical protein
LLLILLQLNVFNDSYYRNAIEMYDGEYFDHNMLIGRVSANSTLLERKQLYQTSKLFDTMGIRVTGSPADGGYGFIAEVVTLPLSPTWRPDLGDLIRYNCITTLSIYTDSYKLIR